MKKISVLLLILYMLLFTNLAQAETVILEYQNHIFARNNNFSVYKLWQEEYADLTTEIDERVEGFFYSQHRNVFQQEEGRYYFGYLNQSAKSFSGAKQTALFLIEREKEEYSQENYKLEGQSLKQDVEGLFFARNILADRVDGLDLFIEAKLLSGIEYRERDYQAQVARRNNMYYFSGSRSGIYSELSQEERWREINFFSYGYSLGFNLVWELDSDLAISFKGDDIHNQILWNDIYTIELDYSDGGRFDYEQLVSSFPAVYDFALKFSRLEVGLNYYDKFYPYLNFELLQSPLGLKLGIYDGMLNLKLDSDNLQANLVTSQLDLFNAEGFALDFSFVPLEIKF